ncbi:MAG TPA: hypothetical protein VHU24_12565, partial [Solirubrobacterales bacterium]|nr:hypothetical protein [Solirubrobacterales bacterium]
MGEGFIRCPARLQSADQGVTQLLTRAGDLGQAESNKGRVVDPHVPEAPSVGDDPASLHDRLED